VYVDVAPAEIAKRSNEKNENISDLFDNYPDIPPLVPPTNTPTYRRQTPAARKVGRPVQAHDDKNEKRRAARHQKNQTKALMNALEPGLDLMKQACDNANLMIPDGDDKSNQDHKLQCFILRILNSRVGPNLFPALLSTDTWQTQLRCIADALKKLEIIFNKRHCRNIWLAVQSTLYYALRDTCPKLCSQIFPQVRLNRLDARKDRDAKVLAEMKPTSVVSRETTYKALVDQLIGHIWDTPN